MINKDKVKTLNISPNFNIDDIYRIREWDYENFKNFSKKEWICYINQSADELRKNSGLKFEVKNGYYIHHKEKS